MFHLAENRCRSVRKFVKSSKSIATSGLGLNLFTKTTWPDLETNAKTWDAPVLLDLLGFIKNKYSCLIINYDELPSYLESIKNNEETWFDLDLTRNMPTKGLKKIITAKVIAMGYNSLTEMTNDYIRKRFTINKRVPSYEEKLDNVGTNLSKNYGRLQNYYRIYGKLRVGQHLEFDREFFEDEDIEANLKMRLAKMKFPKCHFIETKKVEAVESDEEDYSSTLGFYHPNLYSYMAEKYLVHQRTQHLGEFNLKFGCLKAYTCPRCKTVNMHEAVTWVIEDYLALSWNKFKSYEDWENLMDKKNVDKLKNYYKKGETALEMVDWIMCSNCGMNLDEEIPTTLIEWDDLPYDRFVNCHAGAILDQLKLTWATDAFHDLPQASLDRCVGHDLRMVKLAVSKLNIRNVQVNQGINQVEFEWLQKQFYQYNLIWSNSPRNPHGLLSGIRKLMLEILIDSFRMEHITLVNYYDSRVNRTIVTPNARDKRKLLDRMSAADCNCDLNSCCCDNDQGGIVIFLDCITKFEPNEICSYLVKTKKRLYYTTSTNEISLEGEDSLLFDQGQTNIMDGNLITILNETNEVISEDVNLVRTWRDSPEIRGNIGHLMLSNLKSVGNVLLKTGIYHTGLAYYDSLRYYIKPKPTVRTVEIPYVSGKSVLNVMGLMGFSFKKVRINEQFLNLLLNRNITGNLSLSTLIEYGLNISYSKLNLRDKTMGYKYITQDDIYDHAYICYILQVKERYYDSLLKWKIENRGVRLCRNFLIKAFSEYLKWTLDFTGTESIIRETTELIETFIKTNINQVKTFYNQDCWTTIRNDLRTRGIHVAPVTEMKEESVKFKPGAEVKKVFHKHNLDCTHVCKSLSDHGPEGGIRCQCCGFMGVKLLCRLCGGDESFLNIIVEKRPEQAGRSRFVRSKPPEEPPSEFIWYKPGDPPLPLPKPVAPKLIKPFQLTESSYKEKLVDPRNLDKLKESVASLYDSSDLKIIKFGLAELFRTEYLEVAPDLITNKTWFEFMYEGENMIKLENLKEVAKLEQEKTEGDLCGYTALSYFFPNLEFSMVNDAVGKVDWYTLRDLLLISNKWRLNLAIITHLDVCVNKMEDSNWYAVVAHSKVFNEEKEHWYPVSCTQIGPPDRLYFKDFGLGVETIKTIVSKLPKVNFNSMTFNSVKEQDRLFIAKSIAELNNFILNSEVEGLGYELVTKNDLIYLTNNKDCINNRSVGKLAGVVEPQYLQYAELFLATDKSVLNQSMLMEDFNVELSIENAKDSVAEFIKYRLYELLKLKLDLNNDEIPGRWERIKARVVKGKVSVDCKPKDKTGDLIAVKLGSKTTIHQIYRQGDKILFNFHKMTGEFMLKIKWSKISFNSSLIDFMSLIRLPNTDWINKVDIEAIDAVPGWGKSREIVLRSDDETTVITMTRKALEVLKERGCKGKLMTLERAKLETVKTSKLICDEASMITIVDLLACVYRTPLKELRLFGDSNQINVVDMYLKPGVRKIKSVLESCSFRRIEYKSHRIGYPLAEEIGQIITFEGNDSKETHFDVMYLDEMKVSKIKEIQEELTIELILVFYEIDFQLLRNELNCEVEKVHSYQGGEAKRVLVIQHSPKPEGRIHLDKKYCVSAMTRGLDYLCWLSIGVFDDKLPLSDRVIKYNYMDELDDIEIKGGAGEIEEVVIENPDFELTYPLTDDQVLGYFNRWMTKFSYLKLKVDMEKVNGKWIVETSYWGIKVKVELSGNKVKLLEGMHIPGIKLIMQRMLKEIDDNMKEIRQYIKHREADEEISDEDDDLSMFHDARMIGEEGITIQLMDMMTSNHQSVDYFQLGMVSSRRIRILSHIAIMCQSAEDPLSFMIDGEAYDIRVFGGCSFCCAIALVKSGERFHTDPLIVISEQYRTPFGRYIYIRPSSRLGAQLYFLYGLGLTSVIEHFELPTPVGIEVNHDFNTGINLSCISFEMGMIMERLKRGVYDTMKKDPLRILNCTCLSILKRSLEVELYEMELTKQLWAKGASVTGFPENYYSLDLVGFPLRSDSGIVGRMTAQGEIIYYKKTVSAPKLRNAEETTKRNFIKSFMEDEAQKLPWKLAKFIPGSEIIGGRFGSTPLFISPDQHILMGTAVGEYIRTVEAKMFEAMNSKIRNKIFCSPKQCKEYRELIIQECSQTPVIETTGIKIDEGIDHCLENIMMLDITHKFGLNICYCGIRPDVIILHDLWESSAIPWDLKFIEINYRKHEMNFVGMCNIWYAALLEETNIDVVNRDAKLAALRPVVYGHSNNLYSREPNESRLMNYKTLVFGLSLGYLNLSEIFKLISMGKTLIGVIPLHNSTNFYSEKAKTKHVSCYSYEGSDVLYEFYNVTLDIIRNHRIVRTPDGKNMKIDIKKIIIDHAFVVLEAIEDDWPGSYYSPIYTTRNKDLVTLNIPRFNTNLIGLLKNPKIVTFEKKQFSKKIFRLMSLRATRADTTLQDLLNYGRIILNTRSYNTDVITYTYSVNLEDIKELAVALWIKNNQLFNSIKFVTKYDEDSMERFAPYLGVDLATTWKDGILGLSKILVENLKLDIQPEALFESLRVFFQDKLQSDYLLDWVEGFNNLELEVIEDKRIVKNYDLSTTKSITGTYPLTRLKYILNEVITYFEDYDEEIGGDCSDDEVIRGLTEMRTALEMANDDLRRMFTRQSYRLTRSLNASLSIIKSKMEGLPDEIVDDGKINWCESFKSKLSELLSLLDWLKNQISARVKAWVTKIEEMVSAENLVAKFLQDKDWTFDVLDMVTIDRTLFNELDEEIIDTIEIACMEERTLSNGLKFMTPKPTWDWSNSKNELINNMLTKLIVGKPSEQMLRVFEDVLDNEAESKDWKYYIIRLVLKIKLCYRCIKAKLEKILEQLMSIKRKVGDDIEEKEIIGALLEKEKELKFLYAEKWFEFKTWIWNMLVWLWEQFKTKWLKRQPKGKSSKSLDVGELMRESGEVEEPILEKPHNKELNTWTKLKSFVAGRKVGVVTFGTKGDAYPLAEVAEELELDVKAWFTSFPQITSLTSRIIEPPMHEGNEILTAIKDKRRDVVEGAVLDHYNWLKRVLIEEEIDLVITTSTAGLTTLACFNNNIDVVKIHLSNAWLQDKPWERFGYIYLGVSIMKDVVFNLLNNRYLQKWMGSTSDVVEVNFCNKLFTPMFKSGVLQLNRNIIPENLVLDADIVINCGSLINISVERLFEITKQLIMQLNVNVVLITNSNHILEVVATLESNSLTFEEEGVLMPNGKFLIWMGNCSYNRLPKEPKLVISYASAGMCHYVLNFPSEVWLTCVFADQSFWINAMKRLVKRGDWKGTVGVFNVDELESMINRLLEDRVRLYVMGLITSKEAEALMELEREVIPKEKVIVESEIQEEKDSDKESYKSVESETSFAFDISFDSKAAYALDFMRTKSNQKVGVSLTLDKTGFCKTMIKSINVPIKCYDPKEMGYCVWKCIEKGASLYNLELALKLNEIEQIIGSIKFVTLNKFLAILKLTGTPGLIIKRNNVVGYSIAGMQPLIFEIIKTRVAGISHCILRRPLLLSTVKLTWVKDMEFKVSQQVLDKTLIKYKLVKEPEIVQLTIEELCEEWRGLVNKNKEFIKFKTDRKVEEILTVTRLENLRYRLMRKPKLIECEAEIGSDWVKLDTEGIKQGDMILLIGEKYYLGLVVSVNEGFIAITAEQPKFCLGFVKLSFNLISKYSETKTRPKRYELAALNYQTKLTYERVKNIKLPILTKDDTAEILIITDFDTRQHHLYSDAERLKNSGYDIVRNLHRTLTEEECEELVAEKALQLGMENGEFVGKSKLTVVPDHINKVLRDIGLKNIWEKLSLRKWIEIEPIIKKLNANSVSIGNNYKFISWVDLPNKVKVRDLTTVYTEWCTDMEEDQELEKLEFDKTLNWNFEGQVDVENFKVKTTDLQLWSIVLKGGAGDIMYKTDLEDEPDLKVVKHDDWFQREVLPPVMTERVKHTKLEVKALADWKVEPWTNMTVIEGCEVHTHEVFFTATHMDPTKVQLYEEFLPEDVDHRIKDFWERLDYTDHISVFRPENNIRLRSTEIPYVRKQYNKTLLYDYPQLTRPIFTKIFGTEQKSVAKRLGSVKYLQTKKMNLEEEVYGFVRTYFKPNCLEEIKMYQANLLTYDENDIKTWLTRRQDKNKLVTEIENLLEEGWVTNQLNDYKIHVKLESLLKEEPIYDFKDQNARIIVWQSKAIAGIFSPIFIRAKERLKSLLRKEILYADGMTPNEMDNFLSNVNYVKQFMESDMTKLDRQTNETAIEFEFKIYELLGIDLNVLSVWKSIHKHWRFRGKYVRGMCNFQRCTGEATTSLGNFITNMLCMWRVFDKYIRTGNLSYLIGIGDDMSSGITVDGKIKDPREMMASRYNMISKWKTSLNSSTFCCWRIYRKDDGKIGIGPDIVRLWNKFQITNGIHEATSELLEARSLSYAMMLGKIEGVKDNNKFSELPLSNYYDLEFIVQATCEHYGITVQEVYGKLTNLIDMMTNPKARVISLDFISSTK